MFFLNKLLKGIDEDSAIFKNPKINFILGLTTSQIKELKKFAISNGFITQNKQEYLLTDKAGEYLKENPIKSWCCDEFPLRPELNLEYMKLDKTPSTVTKAIRNLAKHLLDGENIKENSMETHIQEELLSQNSKFNDLFNTMEDYLSTNKRVNLGGLYNDFSSYGLTKSVISVLLLGILAKNKDNFAIYEKYQFQLKINQLLFDKIMFSPENFEVQKTVFEQYQVLEDISTLLLPQKTSNILEITKGLVHFISGLDKYTLQTQKLSKTALKLRNTVLNAKDPINLFTIDIPRLMQGKKLEDCDSNFAESFKAVLNELKTADDNMVNELKSFMLNSFNAKTRSELSERFKKAEEYIGAKELKILHSNVVNDGVSDKFWIERIAAYINKSRVPKDWSDEDTADFKVKIKEMALKFEVIEAAVGAENININANLSSILDSFLKLTKSEQFVLLRKMVNA